MKGMTEDPTPDEILDKAVLDSQVEPLARRVATLESNLTVARSENRALRARVLEMERFGQAMEALEDRETNIYEIPDLTEGEEAEATAIICLSDVHVGEAVESSTVNGLNEYTPDICRKSVDHFWQVCRRLIETHRQQIPIKNVILWWGGDVMTGWLHEDQVETNHLTPPEEVGSSIDMIASGLEFIADLDGVERVDVVGSVGNHGRGTRKPRHNSRVRTSWEALLYEQAINAVKGRRWREGNEYDLRPNVHWHPPQGKLNYVRVYNRVIRFTHGDDVSYGGGVGGITIPLNKRIAKWDQAIQADLTVLGHFHTIHDLPDVVVNGSVIGYSPYSQGFGHEEPTQAFFLFDNRFGKRAFEPVHVRAYDPNYIPN